MVLRTETVAAAVLGALLVVEQTRGGAKTTTDGSAPGAVAAPKGTREAGLRCQLAFQFVRFWIAAKPAVTFVALLCLLDAALNIRYPAGEPKFWYLLPSVDAICLLSVYLLLGVCAKRMPAVAHGVLVALFGIVRLLRVADGFEYNNFLRTFNLYMDLPLLPELVRFLYATQSHIAFTFTVLGVVVGLVAFAWVAHRVCSMSIERLSALPVNRRVFAGVTAAFLVASLLRFIAPIRSGTPAPSPPASCRVSPMRPDFSSTSTFTDRAKGAHRVGQA